MAATVPSLVRRRTAIYRPKPNPTNRTAKLLLVHINVIITGIRYLAKASAGTPA